MSIRGTSRVRIPEVFPNASLSVRLSHPLLRTDTPLVGTDVPLIRTDSTLSTIHRLRHIQSHRIPTDVPLRTRQHFQRRETSATTCSQQSRRGSVSDIVRTDAAVMTCSERRSCNFISRVKLHEQSLILAENASLKICCSCLFCFEFLFFLLFFHRLRGLGFRVSIRFQSFAAAVGHNGMSRNGATANSGTPKPNGNSETQLPLLIIYLFFKKKEKMVMVMGRKEGQLRRKQVTASTMGTGGKDTCRCPLGASQQREKFPKKRRSVILGAHVTTFFAKHSTSNAKECVEATQVVLDLELEVQAIETKTRRGAMEDRTGGHTCPLTMKRKIAFHSSVPHSVPQPTARMPGSRSVSHIAVITSVLCNCKKRPIRTLLKSNLSYVIGKKRTGQHL